VIEYFREVDGVTGLIWGFTRGQQLCAGMMLAGILLWAYLTHLQKQPKKETPQKETSK
jgi:prolipoprotein diacylglyceryltransferase